MLTGAGISTASGIPDYRDENGAWKRRPPMAFRAFADSDAARRRYWARSLVGWPRMRDARPNAAHRALERLEAAGRVHHVLTQNVDGLHQRAGSRRVLDLHGRIDEVVCLRCRARSSREAYQARLAGSFRPVAGRSAPTAPDGDADLEGVDLAGIVVPGCEACGGVLKPDVVFFGENVPKPRVEEAYARVGEADLLLVAGSSLMVFSGYRFVRSAHDRGVPVAIVNLGRTRADDDAAVRVRADVAETLGALAAAVA